MEKDILTAIESARPGFSKGQRNIADFILHNYDKAAFMTAGKLGKTVGVSESTVVRFAAELGFDGYPGMRKALQEMIRNRLTSVQRIEVARDTIDDRHIIQTVLNADIEKIQTTLETFDQSAFDAAVSAILSAKHIYILGMRSSMALAGFMGFYLNLILDNVRLVSDSAMGEVYEQIMRIGSDDVFIGISFPRYSSRTVRAMKFASNAGATVIGLTDGENSPFIEIADIMLYARSDMVSFLDSLVAPLSLINALIVSVSNRSKEDLSEKFKRLESLWAEYDVYEHGQD